MSGGPNCSRFNSVGLWITQSYRIDKIWKRFKRADCYDFKDISQNRCHFLRNLTKYTKVFITIDRIFEPKDSIYQQNQQKGWDKYKFTRSRQSQIKVYLWSATTLQQCANHQKKKCLSSSCRLFAPRNVTSL